MKTNLFIPTKIKVGFQKRTDTFTGKLAYVIYYDEKGKIRKETSWSNWRDDKIEAVEFDNTARNGFLFNKGIKRDGYHWGSGRSVIRVYDPRDFEFEITVDNLIGILMHSDVSKRDIVENCVYAWTGGDLVLLPTNSEEYRQSVEYTARQSHKVSARDLVPGRQYTQKKHDEILTYVGRYEWYDMVYHYEHDTNDSVQTFKGKKHIFAEAGSKPGSVSFKPNPVASLSGEVSEDIVDNYASLVDQYYGSIHSQPISKLIIDVDGAEYDAEQQSSIYLYKFDNINGECVVQACVHRWGSDSGVAKLDQYSMSVYITYFNHTDAGFTTRPYQDPNRGSYTRSGSYMYGHRYPSEPSEPETRKRRLRYTIADTAAAKGINPEAITREQIFTCLKSLGYGNVYAELSENKQLTPFSL